MRTPTAQEFDRYFSRSVSSIEKDHARGCLALAKRKLDNLAYEAGLFKKFIVKQDLRDVAQCKTRGLPASKRNPLKPRMLRWAALAFCGFSIMITLAFLFERGIRIESEWRAERNCRIYNINCQQ